jgi:hypothetical protein
MNIPWKSSAHLIVVWGEKQSIFTVQRTASRTRW